MLRWIPASAALAALLLPAVPAAAQTRDAPSLAARVSSCTTGTEASDRNAVFTGSMPLVAGAARMAMRFDLSERLPHHGWKRLAVPGFGSWERSDAGVAGFVYSKRVEQLEAPARYRVRVRFRWYSPGGRVVRSSHRTSHECRQPDPRPDLRVDAIEITPAGDGAVYAVTVANAGRSGALAPFSVGLVVGGVALPERSLPSLAAGRASTLTFDGPACPAGTVVTATADTGDAVAEADERDDTRTRVC